MKFLIVLLVFLLVEESNSLSLEKSKAKQTTLDELEERLSKIFSERKLSEVESPQNNAEQIDASPLEEDSVAQKKRVLKPGPGAMRRKFEKSKLARKNMQNRNQRNGKHARLFLKGTRNANNNGQTDKKEQNGPTGVANKNLSRRLALLKLRSGAYQNKRTSNKKTLQEKAEGKDKRQSYDDYDYWYSVCYDENYYFDDSNPDCQAWMDHIYNYTYPAYYYDYCSQYDTPCADEYDAESFFSCAYQEVLHLNAEIKHLYQELTGDCDLIPVQLEECVDKLVKSGSLDFESIVELYEIFQTIIFNNLYETINEAVYHTDDWDLYNRYDEFWCKFHSLESNTYYWLEQEYMYYTY